MDCRPPMRFKTAALLALLVAAAVIFSLPLGRRPLYSQDEARFALLAREAVERGHWILPRLRDVVYLNKPPLFFWSVALVSLPFGLVSELTAALPSVLSAIAGLLAIFSAGRLLWGWSVGIVAALVLATTPFYFFMAHEALSDMMLTAWLTWALYFFVAALGSTGDRRHLAAFYLCLGGAVFSKGPAALVALLAAIAVILSDDGWQGLRRLHLLMGLAILLLSALPWLVPYLLNNERSYVKAVVVGHYLDWYFRRKPDSRLVSAIGNLGRFLPWTLFLAPALWWWWHSPDPRRRRLLVWTGTLMLALGLSGEQRARYFTPVFPLLALLVAEFLVRGAAVDRWFGRRGAMASTGVTLLGAGAAAVILLGGFARDVNGPDSIFIPSSGWERWSVAVFALAGPAAAMVALRRGSGAAAAVCLSMTVGAVLAIEGVAYPPRYSRWFDIPSFASRIDEQLPAGVPVLAYPAASLSYDYYLRRSIRELGDAESARAFLAVPRSAALLTRDESWLALRSGAHPSWRPLVTAIVGGRRMVLVGSIR